jgi:hypothetical protein
MKLVLDILRRGRALLMDLQPIWVSQENPFLLKADAISKGIDTDNWEIVDSDFVQLSTLFGPFTIDLFAMRENAKCGRFYSRSSEKGALGVDAFTQNWSGASVYAMPPVSLVMRTICKAAVVQLSGALIIPLWKNAKFWNFAFRDGTHLIAMFGSVQIVHMHTLAWEFSKKDVIGGKELQFLVMSFDGLKGSQALESLPGNNRCFKRLFGRDCGVCDVLASV